MLTSDNILIGLQVATGIMLIVLLYHALFIAVDLRRILRRVDDLTKQIEDIVMKPISMADTILQWVMDYIEHDQKNGKNDKKKKK